MRIRVGNTAIAEGMHSIRDQLSELQAQIDEDRKQLPLEQIPRSAMLAKLAEKASFCVEQLQMVQRDSGDAVQSVYKELDRISTSLTELQGLLTSMQNRGTELRSYSFDPITQVVTHLRGSLDRLEKRALAANKTRFWPWALLGAGVIGSSLWALFNPTASTVFLFGDNGSLHEMVTVWYAFLAIALGACGTVWKFYGSYMPKSRGLTYTGLPYRFWPLAALSSYGIMIAITVFYENAVIERWTETYPNNGGWSIFCAVILCLASAVGFIGNLVGHWDDLAN